MPSENEIENIKSLKVTYSHKHLQTCTRWAILNSVKFIFIILYHIYLQHFS